MTSTFKKPIKTYIISTYVLFWILFAITGILVFTDAPQIYQTIMKNVCAWASTFVLLLFFKKLITDKTLKQFIKEQLTKVTFLDFILPMIIQMLIAALSVIIITFISQKQLSSIDFISFSSILPFLLIHLTAGPLGEELGWRSYLLNEFNKKNNLLISSVYIGLLWGFWHFPLWLVSGFSGLTLLFYIASFMLAIISFSVFMSFFYIKKRNIFIAIWIHFLFNVFIQLVVFQDEKLPLLIFVIGLLYTFVSLVIVIKHKKIFLVNHD